RSNTVEGLGGSMRRPDTDVRSTPILAGHRRATTAWSACRNATLTRMRAVALIASSVVPTSVRAADPPAPPRIDLRWAAPRVRLQTSTPRLDPASGWALRYARELEWTQRALLDPPRPTERWSSGDGIEPPSPQAWST